MPNRRDCLRSVAGASAGVAFGGCSLCDALAASVPARAGVAAARRPVMVGKRRVKTIDVHCHVSIPEVADLLKGTKLEGRGRAIGNYVDANLSADRVAAMDEMGIDVQAASINSFWYSADPDLAGKTFDQPN